MRVVCIGISSMFLMLPHPLETETQISTVYIHSNLEIPRSERDMHISLIQHRDYSNTGSITI